MILTPLTNPTPKSLITTLNTLILLSLITMLNQNNLMMTFTLTDMISAPLTTLTLMISSLIILSSDKTMKTNSLIMMINIILLMAFNVHSSINFYILFELSIIPTFILITQQGKQPERLKASMYLIMYTLSASLPLLISILLMNPNTNMMMNKTTNIQTHLPMMMMMAFLVKTPMFMVHLWLPKAHVEAPVEGSMMLAAILLKLGSYGLLRFLPMMEKFSKTQSNLMITIALLGMLSTTITCNRNKDIKAIIAYSSVAHMATTIMALFSSSPLAQSTTMLIMTSHGLSSSLLFLLANLSYQNFHSRNMSVFKGFMNTTPKLSMWWFLALAANIGTPPFLNLTSEIMVMMNMMTWSMMTLMILLITGMTMTTFCVRLFSSMNHNSPSNLKTLNIRSSNQLSLTMHIAPLMLMFLNPTLLMI